MSFCTINQGVARTRLGKRSKHAVGRETDDKCCENHRSNKRQEAGYGGGMNWWFTIRLYAYPIEDGVIFLSCNLSLMF